MGPEKRSDDWQAEDHFENLKKVPGLVECKAAEPISQAIIFFGRQIQDQKLDIAKLPLDVAAIVTSNLQESLAQIVTNVVKAVQDAQQPVIKKVPFLALLSGIGVPTPVCILVWFIGTSKGWW